MTPPMQNEQATPTAEQALEARSKATDMEAYALIEKWKKAVPPYARATGGATYAAVTADLDHAETQADEIERLRALVGKKHEEWEVLAVERDSLKARLAKAEEVIRPFTADLDMWRHALESGNITGDHDIAIHTQLSVGDLIAAASFIEKLDDTKPLSEIHAEEKRLGLE